MSTAPAKMDYRSAVSFETARRGQYQKLDYTPVFRGSAIFFAIVTPQIDTQITFMNYWREKNSIEKVGVLVTLRDTEGRKIARDYLTVTEYVYHFSCHDLLAQSGLPVEAEFRGSIEFEVFSAEDMKFAVSAIEVFYVGTDAISFVHANQRTFNNFEDLAKFGGLNAWQSGFDVHSDEQYVGFAAILNGPCEVKNALAHVVLINSEGRSLERRIELGDVAPHAAKLVTMDDIDGAAEHLGGRPGLIKLDVEMASIFNRLLSGNKSRDGKRLLITHSYYDCSNDSDYVDRRSIPADEYVAFLPFALPGQLDLDLVFYPIYSPATLSFALELRDPEGKIARVFENVASFNSNDNRPLTINVRKTLADHGLEAWDGLYVLRIEPGDQAEPLVPLRLTFGMNYRELGLGSNINASILLNPGYGVKQRTYLWGPIRMAEGASNYILAPYIAKQIEATAPADVKIRFWTRSGVFLEHHRTLANGTALEIEVEKLFHESGVAPDRGELFCWYTLESDSPNFTAYCVHRSSTGQIGADHSF